MYEISLRRNNYFSFVLPLGTLRVELCALSPTSTTLLCIWYIYQRDIYEYRALVCKHVPRQIKSHIAVFFRSSQFPSLWFTVIVGITTTESHMHVQSSYGVFCHPFSCNCNVPDILNFISTPCCHFPSQTSIFRFRPEAIDCKSNREVAIWNIDSWFPLSQVLLIRFHPETVDCTSASGLTIIFRIRYRKLRVVVSHRKLRSFVSIQKQLIVKAIAKLQFELLIVDTLFHKCYWFVSIQKQSIVRVLVGWQSYFVSAIANYKLLFPSRNSRV